VADFIGADDVVIKVDALIMGGNEKGNDSLKVKFLKTTF
jgi:hypothetical protein